MINATHRARAFTLTELMISVALLLIIMLGVNQVFRATSETIGTATAYTSAMRQLRGFFQIALTDFVGPTLETPTGRATTGIVERPNLPFLVIRGEQISGWRNRDAPAEEDFRIDTLSFFTRGEFKRRTGMRYGNREFFVADQVSDQAFVWYGHLMVPNNAGDPNVLSDYFGPGWNDPTANPNNYYAQNWRVGRAAILMLDRDPDQPPLNFVDAYRNVDYSFLGSRRGLPDPRYPLAPFQWGTPAWTTNPQNNDTAYPQNRQAQVQFHWVDVAAATIGEGGVGTARGYWKVVSDAQARQPNDWWRGIATGPSNTDAYRFYANPYIRKPLNPNASNTNPAWQQMAMNVPPVLSGCTDFIVEFAGDYDNSPGIDIAQPVTSGGLTAYSIQWYGVPRDTDGDGDDDVRPVSAVRGGRRPFEKELPSGRNPERYVCVWGPAEMELSPQGRSMLPMLIRITVRMVDDNGRLGNGISQEYIFKVRHE